MTTEQEAFHAEERARITGLSARDDLNDLLCKLLHFHEEKGRWEVQVIMTGESCRVRPASLCLLYTSPSPRDQRGSRMPSSA